MPFSIIQAGTSLQFVDTSGTLTTLTLPTTATLDAGVTPRFIVYGNYVVVVNSPNTPLTIDTNGIVRPLTPRAPRTGPVIAAGSSGALTGTYQVKYSFIIKDAAGTVIAESDLSPGSNTVTISAKMLQVTGVETSSDPITARRLYRTTTNGAVFFPWLDIDGNVVTQVQDDLSDAGLALFAAPTLGSVPHLITMKEWRNRLWGVDDISVDTLRFAQADSMWSWPSSNSISIPGIGRDAFGIRALMPRREALGVGRRDLIWQVTGFTPDDFSAIKLSEIIGVESQDTVATFRDTVWWLWKDGVYQWDDDGLVNVSDGKVKSWFSTDTYFNRNMFPFCFATFDPLRLKYKLFLAAAGSTSVDRWVEYDIQTRTWWGPHKTSALSPTAAFLLTDAQDKQEVVLGSSSDYIWKEQSTATDNVSTGISVEIITKFYDGNMPDYEKYWGQLSVLGKVQAAGTVSITPKVGYLNVTASTALSYDMTKGRQRLGRLGVGKTAQLTFTHSTAGEPVELYGLEIPYSIVGHR